MSPEPPYGYRPDDPDYRSYGHWLRVRAFHAANATVCRAYHRLTVLSPPKLPPVGPAVLACNHVSGLDPSMLQSTMPRPVVWMMAEEFYDTPLKPVFDLIDAIPVDRGNARSEAGAIRTALRVLKDGRVLGIFPEGWIEKTDALLPFEPGAAALAQRAGATVHPAYLTGTMRRVDMLRAFAVPQDAAVAFGRPLPPPTGRRGGDDFSSRLEASVAALKRRVDASGVPGTRRTRAGTPVAADVADCPG